MHSKNVRGINTKKNKSQNKDHGATRFIKKYVMSSVVYWIQNQCIPLSIFYPMAFQLREGNLNKMYEKKTYIITTPFSTLETSYQNHFKRIIIATVHKKR